MPWVKLTPRFDWVAIEKKGTQRANLSFSPTFKGEDPPHQVVAKSKESPGLGPGLQLSLLDEIVSHLDQRVRSAMRLEFGESIMKPV